MVRLIIERLAILAFYRSKIVVDIKLYVVLLNILPIVIKTELFKYNYRRRSIVGYNLESLRLLK